MPSGSSQDVFRIAAFSGYTGDKWSALKEQAEGSGCDVLFGDYLAEMNLVTRALELREHPELGYEQSFLHHLRLAAAAIGAKRPKIITNAGALNPKGCAERVVEILNEEGIRGLKVAYVEGDNLMPRMDELRAKGETFHHLEDSTRLLSSWHLEPASANAYVGARGIYEALRAGADMVISGRCTDASPVIAAANWYHKWGWSNYDALAGALLAGHCVECGAYVTGGNSSGFRAIKDKYYDFSMGIAEINRDGTFIITKQPNLNGVVNSVTVRSQILYEIQGNVYLNPDVQALIDDIKVTDLGGNRVIVSGVRGLPPPETTKAAICAVAGWQAETMVFATGLDIKDKFDTLRLQINNHIKKLPGPKFDLLDMTQYGVAKENPDSEAEGTAMLRIFAQAKDIEAFGPTRNLMAFINPEGLGHFPGFQWLMDSRICIPRPYMEYWPGRVKQKHLPLTVSFVGSTQKILVPAVTQTAPVHPQSDYDNENAFNPSAYGPTTRGPLGWVVHARSGDKGGNANVGFFVRNRDEYEWLRTLLSKQFLISLLAHEYEDNRLERVELPGLLAVHFVIHDYLGKGVSSTVRMDCLAKSVAEFLRARYVDVPNKFLGRGKI